MIVKRIRTSKIVKTAKGTARYARTLSRYIVRAEPADLDRLRRVELDETHKFPERIGQYMLDRDEDVIFFGQRNCADPGDEDDKNDADPDTAADDFRRKVESAGLADLVEHWVISRRADENDADETFADTLELVVDGLGAQRCPLLWAVHGDTDHRHLHVAIAWVDAKSLERVSKHPWSVKAAHAAIAVAQEKLGWAPEPNAIYRVENGKIFDNQTGEVVGIASDPSSWCRSAPSARKRDADITAPKLDASSLRYEAETGLMSRRRIAIEIAKPIFDKAAGDLAQMAPSPEKMLALAARLASEGVYLARVRKGAKLMISGMPVQTSINRQWSCAKIEEVFGPIPEAGLPTESGDLRRELYPEGDIRRAYYAQKRVHDEEVRLTKQQYTDPAMRPFVRRCLGSLDEAVLKCEFPELKDWQLDGATLRSPDEVFAEELGIRIFRAEVAATQIPPPTYELEGKNTRRIGKRIEAYLIGENQRIIPIFTDVGDKIYVLRANDPDAVRIGIELLAARGAQCIEAINLTKEEGAAARFTAQRLGVGLIMGDEKRTRFYPAPNRPSSRLCDQDAVAGQRTVKTSNINPVRAARWPEANEAKEAQMQRPPQGSPNRRTPEAAARKPSLSGDERPLANPSSNRPQHVPGQQVRWPKPLAGSDAEEVGNPAILPSTGQARPTVEQRPASEPAAPQDRRATAPTAGLGAGHSNALNSPPSQRSDLADDYAEEAKTRLSSARMTPPTNDEDEEEEKRAVIQRKEALRSNAARESERQAQRRRTQAQHLESQLTQRETLASDGNPHAGPAPASIIGSPIANPPTLPPLRATPTSLPQNGGRLEPGTPAYEQLQEKTENSQRAIRLFLKESAVFPIDYERDRGGAIWPIERSDPILRNADFSLADDAQRKELNDRLVEQEEELQKLKLALIAAYDRETFAKGHRMIARALPVDLQRLADARLPRKLGQNLLQAVEQEIQEAYQLTLLAWRASSADRTEKRRLAKAALGAVRKAGVRLGQAEDERLRFDAGIRRFRRGDREQGLEISD